MIHVQDTPPVGISTNIQSKNEQESSELVSSQVHPHFIEEESEKLTAQRYREQLQEEIYRVASPSRHIRKESYSEVAWVEYPIEVLEIHDYRHQWRHDFPVQERFWCHYRDSISSMFAQLIESATLSVDALRPVITWNSNFTSISIDTTRFRPFTPEEIVELLLYTQRGQEHWHAAIPEPYFWSNTVVPNIPKNYLIDPIKWGLRALKLAGGIAAHYGRDLPMPYLAGAVSDAAAIIARHARAGSDSIRATLSPHTGIAVRELLDGVDQTKRVAYAILLLKIAHATDRTSVVKVNEIGKNTHFSRLVDCALSGIEHGIGLHHYAITVRACLGLGWDLSTALSFTADYAAMVSSGPIAKGNWFFDPTKPAIVGSRKNKFLPQTISFIESLRDEDPYLLRHSSLLAQIDDYKLFHIESFSIREASQIYCSIVRSVGIGNPNRAKKVLEMFTSMVNQNPEFTAQMLGKRFCEHLSGVSLPHPLLSLMEGKDATMHLPGVSLYLAAATSIEEFRSRDDCTMTQGDLEMLSHEMASPLAIRGHTQPLLKTGYRRTPLLCSDETLNLMVKPKELIEFKGQKTPPIQSALNNYLGILKQLRSLLPQRHTEVMKNYMAVCAAKMPVPLRPHSSFLEAFVRVFEYQPESITRSVFSHPHEKSSVKDSNARHAVDKYLVVSNLLDASVLGLTNTEDITELLLHTFEPPTEREIEDLHRETFFQLAVEELYPTVGHEAYDWYYDTFSEVIDFRRELKKILDEKIAISRDQFLREGNISEALKSSIELEQKKLNDVERYFIKQWYPDWKGSLEQLLKARSRLEDRTFNRTFDEKLREKKESKVHERWNELCAFTSFLDVVSTGMLTGMLTAERASKIARIGIDKVLQGDFRKCAPSTSYIQRTSRLDPRLVGITKMTFIGMNSRLDDLEGNCQELISGMNELDLVFNMLTQGEFNKKVEEVCTGYLSLAETEDVDLNQIDDIAAKVLGDLNLSHVDLSKITRKIVANRIKKIGEVEKFIWRLKRASRELEYGSDGIASLSLLNTFASIQPPTFLLKGKASEHIQEREGALHTGKVRGALTKESIRASIKEARLASFALYPIGGKVHTLHPIPEQIPNLLNEVFGTGSSSFALQHGGTTLLLPPMPSAGEMELLCEFLIRWGVLDESRPELQLCGPSRLPPEKCAILGASLFLGTTRGVRYKPDAFKTSSHDSEVQFCCLTYDAGGHRVNLPFCPQGAGRTDILGRRSVQDANIFQPLHTVLCQSAFREGSFTELGDWYISEFTEILSQHNLSSVLSIPWINGRYEYSKVKQEKMDLHYEKGLKPCIDAYFDCVTRFQETGRASGVVFKVRHLFAELSDRIRNIQRELIQSNDFEDEKAILFADWN